MKRLVLLLLVFTVLQTSQGSPTTSTVSKHHEDLDHNTVNEEEDYSEYGTAPDMIEGDIKVTHVQAAIFKKGGWDALVGLEAWYPRHGKWSRTIPYVIDEKIRIDSKVRNAIMFSIGLYHLYTCLRFVPKENYHKNYIHFDDRKGCWSHIGRQGGRQYISLSNGCYSAVPAHEIMHALGRYHEQSRPDRDTYITINTTNILERTLSNFRIHSQADTQCIPYDYGSLMHYGSHAFSKNKHPTILSKIKGIIFGQRSTMSPSDALHVNIRYCPERVIKLQGGKGPYEGRVEVLWKGQWGTVCDDKFDLNDAHTICRYLGYSKALQYYIKALRFGQGRGPIWFDNMQCRGNEYTPFFCPKNKIGSHNCRHNEDVGVVCQNNIRLTSGTGRLNGRVEVYYRGLWGTVCYDSSSFDLNDASVICRQLGGYRAKRIYHMERKSGQIWLGGLKCTGSESQVFFCPSEPLGELDTTSCKDAAVHCY